MTKERVAGFATSLDGFGAGPDRSLENPLGLGGAQLHARAFPTRTFRRTVLRAEGGTTGPDDELVAPPVATRPTTLACMHGSAWQGDGARLLGALTDALDA